MARQRDDRELIDRCLEDAPGAWREFVERFAPTVRAVARRYLKLHGQTGHAADLDDVTQEVFRALLRHNHRLLRNYNPTYTVKTYLGMIARTEVHRLLRKRRPGLADPADFESASADDASAAAEVAEENEILHRALEALPARDAEILRLRFFRGFDYRAIAEALSIPEASVGQTLFRAKQRLKEELEKHRPDPE